MSERSERTSGLHGDSGAMLRRSAASWVACLCATVVLFSVFDGREWFWRAAGAITLVIGLGTAARVLRVPAVLVVTLQAGAGVAYLIRSYAAETARGGLIPDRDTWSALRGLGDRGLDQLGQLNPPVIPSAEVSFLTVVLVAVAALSVDALAAGHRQTALAGLPLLALYVVPTAVLPDGVDAWLFALPGFGYLLLLATDNRDRLRGWGIPISGSTAGALGGGRLGRMTRNVGVAVLSLSIAIPAAVPRINDGAFGEKGVGQSQGRTISTLDPLVSMRRQLYDRQDIELMRVRTSSAKPSELYLRTVTLDEFTGTEWKAGRREVKKFEPDLPEIPGLGPGVEASPVDTAIEVSDTLESDYLPLPHPATRVEIDGKWRLDPLTFNVVSYRDRDQIAQARYAVTSLDLAPKPGDVLDEAPNSPYLTPYLALPEIPTSVLDTATRVTQGAEGPLQIGIALQQWFRRPGNFVYDLRTPPGTGSSALVDFLRDRRGYCEHFASTMAVMARALGIPSRVNVGFTAGQLADDGIERVISTDDAHAWPELWLPGVGWTRFEPTPGAANSNPSAPSWLSEGLPPQDKPGDSPEPDQGRPPEEQAASGAQAAGAAPASGTATIDCAVTPDANGCDQPPLEDPQLLPGIGSSVLRDLLLIAFVLLVICGPGLSRVLVRRRRWVLARAAGGVEAAELAWRELRDDALDLGYPWPPARTPRRTAADFSTQAELSAPTDAELALLAITLERGRYARDGASTDADRLRSAVIAIRRGAARTTGRRARIRAFVAPRSVLIAVKSADGRSTGRRLLRPGVTRRAWAIVRGA